MFQEFGVADQLLEAAHVHRLESHEAKDAGFRYSGDLAGIAFPYPHFVSGQCVTARMRRDMPDLDADGKPIAKYIKRYGDRPFLYFPPNAQQRLRDAQRIIVVEAEKSVLSITALSDRNNLNLLAVGCGGCWGWNGRIDKQQTPDGGLRDVRGPITDLNYIVTNGKDIVILFDSNSHTNPWVRTARRELASHLTSLGARVLIADLPQVNGVNGPDDLIKEAGDAALVAVLKGARPFEGTAIAEAEMLIESATEADVSGCVAAIALVQNADVREQLIRDLRAKCRNSTELRKRVNQQVTEVAANQQRFKDAVRCEALLRMKFHASDLLLEIMGFFEKFLYAANGVSMILGLWVMNTWLFDVFDTTPYLLIYSAVKGCGKTTVMELLLELSARPHLTAGMTPAAMFRIVEQEKPTLLIDEAESLAANNERGNDVTQIANTGYKKGAGVLRCGDKKDGFALQRFATYCPKAFACIGKLEGALLDRCIVICLEKAPRDANITRAYSRLVKALAEPIREKLESYALKAADPLKSLLEHSPDQGYWPQIYGREAELFEPLLMHAKMISPEAEEQALKVAQWLSKGKQQSQADETSVGKAISLLAILDRRDGEEFIPFDIVEELQKEESWSADLERCQSGRSKAAVVGRFLHHFGLASKHTRAGAAYSLPLTKHKLRAHIPAEVSDGG
jgi:hypothetical protein